MENDESQVFFFQKNLLADTVDGMLSLVIDTSDFSDG